MIRGIIFDMDNTLLQSCIDFPAMKRDIHDYMLQQGVIDRSLPLEEHTCATVIEHAKQQGASAEQHRHIMEIATKHEIAGMTDAGLEPGVTGLLEQLHGRYPLAVVTNNAYPAAMRALQDTRIAHLFDLVVGREQMASLKPSSSGYEYVLRQFPELPQAAWLSVGDSWIDGKGSEAAGIRFVSYRTPLETMNRRGVRPIGRIEHIGELLSYLE